MSSQSRLREIWPQIREELAKAKECRHLGPELDQVVDCEACPGRRTRLKLRACTVYGACLPAVRQGIVPSCIRCGSVEPRISPTLFATYQVLTGAAEGIVIDQVVSVNWTVPRISPTLFATYQVLTGAAEAIDRETWGG